MLEWKRGETAGLDEPNDASLTNERRRLGSASIDKSTALLTIRKNRLLFSLYRFEKYKLDSEVYDFITHLVSKTVHSDQIQLCLFPDHFLKYQPKKSKHYKWMCTNTAHGKTVWTVMFMSVSFSSVHIRIRNASKQLNPFGFTTVGHNSIPFIFQRHSN